MSTLKVNAIRGTGASSDAISVNSTDGTCIVKATNNLSNRNLIINGAMMVNQYGSSSTVVGYVTVDRFAVDYGGENEACTFAQHALTSSDTGPWEKGFRYSLHVTNGNQTGGAGPTDEMNIDYRFEAQDIANSGWNYTSTSSYITLSFWVKSSVAQDFKFYLKTEDGTEKGYPMSTGALSADTWTKITKTIPGHADLQFDNDTGKGFNIEWFTFLGTDRTGTVTDNAWMTYNGSTRVNDMTSTWWTTNDATFELTGVQLEVSDHATEFEHLPYGVELARCQRYYEGIYMTAGTAMFQGTSGANGKTENTIFAVEKRAQATWSLEGNASWSGATANVFTSKNSATFHHGSTEFSLGDAAQDLCGSFSADL